MADKLFSEHWYRVADLRPSLRQHVVTDRHVYRDQVWYILRDPLTGKSHRFSAATRQLIGMMNGQNSVSDIWMAACDRLGDDAPTQDEFIRLMSQLHSSDLLIADVMADKEELFRRSRKVQLGEIKQKLWSPLALRIPLIDPNRFVTRTMPLVAPIFSRFGALVWLTVLVWGVVVAALEWDGLTTGVADRVLTASNILLVWLIYPVVKAIHELGHAYAVKKWNGDVHEMGVMLIVFMPIPYVDASDSISFPQKHRRMLVSAMGIIVELFLAAIAVIVWAEVEQGIVRAIAFNVILICGASSLLFNGNPLLRFDGYYVLADGVEIPNLGTRANKYMAYLFQRHLFGMKEAENPVRAPGEAPWFFFFATASFVYRMFIMFAIILFVATRFFFVGVILAFWAAFTQIVLPLFKIGKFVMSDPRLGRQRGRARAVTAGLVGAALVVLFAVPVPYATMAEGIVKAPESAVVRTGAPGWVDAFLVRPGDHVEQGSPIIRGTDPLLVAQVQVLEARLAEQEARLAQVMSSDPRQAEPIREAIAAARADLDDARERSEKLVVTSPASGTFVVPAGDDLIGRFLPQGEVAAYVLNADFLEARVVVAQAAVGLVRGRWNGVEVWPTDLGQAHAIHADLLRAIPGGTTRLPAQALGTSGGGRVAVDPADPDGLKAFARIFEFDLRFRNPYPEVSIGHRVTVRFDHGREPLGAQILLNLRQLFLERFEV
ncbi:peptidase M50 [Pseudooceanicola sp. LIPI14-2-Ac024]|uniref:peptidase M50 n=1 Tax=Pseudooceanicola sp. LIPI14-2-Ac024 TaxID=3344875 RepID=UPI0035CF5B66